VEIIRPTDGLLRRIPTYDPSYFKPDNRISSLAFKPRKIDTDGLSVDLERLTTHQKAVFDHRKYRLARLEAAIPFYLGLNCIHAPQGTNPAHSLIQGDFTKQICRQLASSASLIVVES